MHRWDRPPDLAGNGASFLLYGLLDVVVDGYFDTVQAFDDYHDDISDGIFSELDAERGIETFSADTQPSNSAISGLVAALPAPVERVPDGSGRAPALPKGTEARGPGPRTMHRPRRMPLGPRPRRLPTVAHTSPVDHERCGRVGRGGRVGRSWETPTAG